MDLDTLAVFKPVTKWNAVVHDPRRMPELARRAFREALSGRPGAGPSRHSAGRAGGRVRIRRRRVRPVAGGAIVSPRGRARRRSGVSRRRRVAAAGAPAADRRGRRRRGERRRAARARAGAAPAVRLSCRRQMALGVVATDSPHFIGHGGIIGGDAVHAGLRRGRRDPRGRLPLLVVDVGRARPARAPASSADQHQHRSDGARRAGAARGRAAGRCRPRARRPAGRAGRCRRSGRRTPTGCRGCESCARNTSTSSTR